MLPLFAFNEVWFTQIVVKCLAVGGAFLAGYFATGIATWLVDRWMTGGKSYPGLYKATKNVGGVGAAVLAAYLLFGSGGGGSGDGDEAGGGPATTQGTGGTGTNPTRPTDDPKPPEPRPPELPQEIGGRFERVRVTVLAGADVRDGRFYQIEEDSTTRTLEELRTEMSKRKQTSKKPLGIVPVYPLGSGIDTTGALRLIKFAQEERFPIIPLDTPK